MDENLCTIDNLLFLERRGRLAGSNFCSNQSEISVLMRRVLISWLENVVEKFKLLSETYFLAVAIIDYTLSKIQIKRESLQLYGVSALLLASKKEEVDPIESNDLIYICDGSFTKEEISLCEKEIFLLLGGDLNFPIVINYLRVLSLTSDTDLKCHDMAKFILELYSICEGFNDYLTSVLTTAAHTIACEATNFVPSNAFNIAQPILDFCVHSMLKSIAINYNETSTPIFKKFFNPKFHGVSKIKLPELRECPTLPNNLEEYAPLYYIDKLSILPIFNPENYTEMYDIGRGTYGKVVKVRDSANKPYALKTIIKNDYVGEISQSLILELSILTIAKHPNVLSVHAFNETGFLLEYMNSDVKGAYMSSEERLTVVHCLIDAVKYLHNLGIVHMDIKPQNVLITQTNNDIFVKLGDFGTSRGSGITLMRTYEPEVYTLYYRAPEILLGAVHYDNRADIWALGCTLFEIITGRILIYENTEEYMLLKLFKIFGTHNEENWPGITSFKKFKYFIAFTKGRGIPWPTNLDSRFKDVKVLIESYLTLCVDKRPRSLNVL